MDTLSPDERSERMSRVRSRDTKPELQVRKLVHSMGFRYRLHDSSLPGKPDLVFRKHSKVIWVHGCFWHRHNCKNGRRLPKSRQAFWTNKLEGNRERDKRNQRRVRALGYSYLVIWECQLRDTKKLEAKIRKFLAE